MQSLQFSTLISNVNTPSGIRINHSSLVLKPARDSPCAPEEHDVYSSGENKPYALRRSAISRVDRSDIYFPSSFLFCATRLQTDMALLRRAKSSGLSAINMVLLRRKEGTYVHGDANKVVTQEMYPDGAEACWEGHRHHWCLHILDQTAKWICSLAVFLQAGNILKHISHHGITI